MVWQILQSGMVAGERVFMTLPAGIRSISEKESTIAFLDGCKCTIGFSLTAKDFLGCMCSGTARTLFGLSRSCSTITTGWKIWIPIWKITLPTKHGMRAWIGRSRPCGPSGPLSTRPSLTRSTWWKGRQYDQESAASWLCLVFEAAAAHKLKHPPVRIPSAVQLGGPRQRPAWQAGMMGWRSTKAGVHPDFADARLSRRRERSLKPAGKWQAKATQERQR